MRSEEGCVVGYLFVSDLSKNKSIILLCNLSVQT